MAEKTAAQIAAEKKQAEDQRAAAEKKAAEEKAALDKASREKQLAEQQKQSQDQQRAEQARRDAEAANKKQQEDPEGVAKDPNVQVRVPMDDPRNAVGASAGNPDIALHAPQNRQLNLRLNPKFKGDMRTEVYSGPYDHLIEQSKVRPGQECWIILDDAGIPISIQAEDVPYGVPCCRGRVQASTNASVDGLVTVSGAPITIPLSPRPEVRNPPSGEQVAPPVVVDNQSTSGISNEQREAMVRDTVDHQLEQQKTVEQPVHNIIDQKPGEKGHQPDDLRHHTGQNPNPQPSHDPLKGSTK